MMKLLIIGVASVLFVAALSSSSSSLYAQERSTTANNSLRRLDGADGADGAGAVDNNNNNNNNNNNEITPLDQICPDNFPPLHAVLHDRRPEQVKHYQDTVGHQTEAWNGKGDDTPLIEVVHNHKFAVWKMFKHYHTEASAWDIDGYVKGPGWREPIAPYKTVTELEGDWAAFTSWFHDNYGHFMHDHLSTIAYLKSVVPETTKFMLVDGEVTRKVIEFIDPEFYKRVMWIQRDQVFHVKGSLTVAVPIAIPITLGCCGGWEPMRQWLATAHPVRPKRKTIVFYSRGGSKDTHHGRVIEEKHEQDILDHIRLAMKMYNRPEELVIFTGQKAGKTMPIDEQFNLFRSAHTIIGPHGSGLGGNFAWTDPFTSSCEERTKLLEFIPGQDSAQVQNLYATYFPNIRKWPLDYHSVLYTKESTPKTTYIDIGALDDALGDMWGTKLQNGPELGFPVKDTN